MNASHRAALAFVAGLICISCGTESGNGAARPTCNGFEALCERRVDEVAYPMTHNAMSNAEAGWSLPNQNFGITRQLEDGIRGLMLDTYEEDGKLLLCHMFCALGSQPLGEGLEEIKAFLDANPGELVSIIFENYISHARTSSAFEETGLIDFVYAHDAGGPWPTLGELIEADTRLLVFQEKLPQDADFPWLMAIWDHAGETPFSFSAPEDFNCDPNRGDAGNPLFLLNHFLTRPVGGSPDLAEMVNYNPLFIDRARQCEEERDALPNFVAVDFYDIGNVFEVVDALNGL
ncbi:MAG: PI-PLC domain-containing protein [Polyangiales bacterium]